MYWSFEDLESDICKNSSVLKEICSKSIKYSIFWRASRKCDQFGFIYSKYAENRRSFEIYLATITTGSLSFGLTNGYRTDMVNSGHFGPLLFTLSKALYRLN